MSEQKRSARYPSATWEECKEFLAKLDGLGGNGASLDILAQACGLKNPKTKSFQSKISSSRMFGLIRIKDGTASLTDEGRSLLYPTEPDIRPLELVLFAQPKLYNDLLKAYESKSLPRRDLFENILVKDYGLSDVSKRRAAECFIASAEELGIMENGVVSYDAALDRSTNKPTASISPDSTESQLDVESSDRPLAITADVNPVFTLSIPTADGNGSIEIRIPKSASTNDLLMARGMLDIYLCNNGISTKEGSPVNDL